MGSSAGSVVGVGELVAVELGVAGGIGVPVGVGGAVCVAVSDAVSDTVAVGDGSSAVAVGDLNGDGILDLVVADQGAATVNVLLRTPVV